MASPAHYELHKACIDQEIDGVRRCIERGDDVNAVDTSGATPLHHACTQGNDVITKLPIDRGADVNAQAGITDMNAEAFGGVTPLHSLMLADFSDTAVDILKSLLTQGADINKHDGEGRTPLAYLCHCYLLLSCDNNHVADWVECLLSSGASSDGLYTENDEDSNDPYSVFSIICHTGGVEAVDRLCTYGITLPRHLEECFGIPTKDDGNTSLDLDSFAIVLCRAGMDCADFLKKDAIEGSIQDTIAKSVGSYSHDALLQRYLQLFVLICPHDATFAQQLKKKSFVNASVPACLNQFFEHYQSPATLESLTVHAIRQRLCQVSGNCSILPRITALGEVLPPALLRHLRLSDETDALLEELQNRDLDYGYDWSDW